jgi:hypothetical protein
MIVSFSQGQLVVSPYEIQCRLKHNAIVLQAMLDDVRFLRPSLLLVADAGVVKWSIKLDSEEQFAELLDITGLSAEYI